MEPLEQLQQENESLKAQLQTAEENYTTLEKLSQEQAEKSAEEMEQLKMENEVIKAVNEELTAKVEDLSAVKSIGAAGEKAQAKAKPELPTETFEVDGEKYRFIAPVFTHRGSVITAEKALTDTALLQELVSKGIGVISRA